MDAGLVIGVAALVVGIAALAVPFRIEWLKKPRLEIVPSTWLPTGPVGWTFATVRVRNKPLTGTSSRLLTRQAAQGCTVDIDFFDWRDPDVRIRTTMPGRWSSHQQPIRSVPNVQPWLLPSATGAPGNVSMPVPFDAEYDPTLDPRHHDVPVSEDGEEVAVAILLRRGEAFAFSTESYDHPDFANPDWKLDHGTYRIVVRVHRSEVSHF